MRRARRGVRASAPARRARPACSGPPPPRARGPRPGPPPSCPSSVVFKRHHSSAQIAINRDRRTTSAQTVCVQYDFAAVVRAMFTTSFMRAPAPVAPRKKDFLPIAAAGAGGSEAAVQEGGTLLRPMAAGRAPSSYLDWFSRSRLAVQLQPAAARRCRAADRRPNGVVRKGSGGIRTEGGLRLVKEGLIPSSEEDELRVCAVGSPRISVRPFSRSTYSHISETARASLSQRSSSHPSPL